MQFLITAIVAVILLVGVASSCPSGCRCINYLNGLHVNCSSRGLRSIPRNLPTNTFVLLLHENRITSIESDTFNNFRNLAQLDLDNNYISVIDDNNFNNLPSLKYLYLHQNRITSIKSDTFNNLRNLNRLDLDNNYISVIDDNNFNNLPSLKYLYLHQNRITSIKSDTFNNLRNLNRLDLYHNYISVIEDNNFSNLPKLEILYLNNNKITSIKSDTFHGLTKLQKLWLQYNPISVVEKNAFNTLPNLEKLEFHMYCAGCDKVPFWRWLKSNRRFTTYIYCNDFGGEKLSNLQLSNFNDFNNCSDVPTVEVQEPSYSVTAGNSVTLECTVSSSLPITSVQWQRRNGGFRTTIYSTTNKYSGSTTTTPSLTIFSAASSDVGTYTCFASNSIGTGQSTTTTLSVIGNVPTVQVQKPSYYVTAGHSVTLECTVSSSLPITSVQWQRRNGFFRRTINSNTHKYSGSTTTTPSLTIFSAASSDVGTYTCFASNSFGTGQSTTTELGVTGQSTTTTLSVTGTNDGNGSVWCSRHGDWTCLVCMFFMISLQYIMSNI